MGLFDRFLPSRLKPEATPQEPSAPAKGGLPTVRISAPEDAPVFSNLTTGLPWSFATPKNFPIQVYDLLTDLCLMNPDLRQALGHIVQLGNTGHNITVEAKSDVALEAVINRVNTQSQIIFPWGGGAEGLVNALFAQIGRSGAISCEWVPNKDLTGIDKVFLVPVREIRWIARQDKMGYFPVQIPRQSAYAQNIDAAPIQLNPRTYFYLNLETMDNSPYAIPPFLAALEPIGMQRDMVKNIRSIIKKLGIMGLMTYKVAPPEQMPGESQDKYMTRCLNYLTQVTENMKGGFKDGIAAGFMGSFEFDVNSVTGDARGIAEIFKMNEEQLFSAIGADPAMHGRTYSTTETYASVVYSKMISQLKNLQCMTAQSLEFGWGLDLLLAGIPATKFEVGFRPSEALNNLQESQAKMLDIANAEALYMGGIINQQQKANLLGFDKPDQPEPRADPNAQDKNLDQRPNTGAGADNADRKASKKQQPKESQSRVVVEFVNGRYKAKADVPILVSSSKPMVMEFVKKSDKGDHLELDPAVEAKYRRFLQAGSAGTGAS